ncbi:MAG: hypothetical protein ABIU30_05570 [Ferruginibacter sp.]
MRHTIIIIATFLIASACYGQSLIRQDNETAEMFADRLKPDSSELAHAVLETKSLNNSGTIIVAFYKKTVDEVKQMPTYVDHNKYDIIIGYLYIPTSLTSYRKVLIDTIFPDGGDPEIISVFFANADKDSRKELIVLCKYPQVHYDYGGAFYETFIYDNPSNNTEHLSYFNELSEKFWGCECAWRAEEKRRPEKAKFKTAKDVKAKLKKLGF